MKEGYLVVIGELFPFTYGPPGVDADMLLGVNSDGLCVAVGVAAVVDVTCTPALQAPRNNHRGKVNSKQNLPWHCLHHDAI